MRNTLTAVTVRSEAVRNYLMAESTVVTKKDSENLHQYRQQKVSPGRRTIRKQHYAIQPHDIVIFDKKQFETSGCHNNGARAILLPQKKSVSVKKLSIYRYAGGYFKSEFA